MDQRYLNPMVVAINSLSRLQVQFLRLPLYLPLPQAKRTSPRGLKTQNKGGLKVTMGKIIDLFSKTEFNENEPDLEDRIDMCTAKEEIQGYCDCKYCLFKRSLAEELVVNASKSMVNHMKETKDPYYFLDLLDVIYVANEFLKSELDKKK